MIEIFDNFFPEKVREEIYRLLLRPQWGLTGGRDGRRFWHIDGLQKEEYFSEYLFYLIQYKIRRRCRIKRIYANGQTAGQCGNPHYDDGDMTFLYYPNPEWKLEDQGHLVFLEGEDEVSKMITYKSNRGVLFPTSLKHYGDAPHRLFSGLRISLAYKLWN